MKDKITFHNNIFSFLNFFIYFRNLGWVYVNIFKYGWLKSQYVQQKWVP